MWSPPFQLSRGALSVTLAALVTGLVGTLLQTFARQQTLWTLGVDLGPWTAVRQTLHDLLFFLPFFTVMALVALACGLPVAGLLAQRFRALAVPLFALAGAVALHVAFVVANNVAPLPTVVAAARTPGGHFALLVTGSIGALACLWSYRSLGRRRPPGRDRTAALAAGALVLAIAAAFHFTRGASITVPDPPPSFAYEIRTVADGLVHPWALALLPDGRMLVTERPGRLRLLTQAGELREAPVPGVPDVLAGGQGGLMDLKLSPRFAETRALFLTYACGTRLATATCLAKARFENDTLTDLRELFRAEPANEVSLQYGSRIAFLPDDTLVMTVGDKFDFAEQAQNGRSHLGKIIRLHLDGSVPDDNPFVNAPAMRGELYSLGHRNPQGLFYDRERGQLLETEHGPRGGDELNVVHRGENYGWPLATHGVNYPGDLVTPFRAVPRARAPLHHWTPSIAPSDVAVYHGEAFPALRGGILVAALAGRAVWMLTVEGGEVMAESALFTELDRRIRQVVPAPDGSLYLLTDHDPGQVLQVVPVTAPEASDPAPSSTRP